jgi:hypothetical protein
MFQMLVAPTAIYYSQKSTGCEEKCPVTTIYYDLLRFITIYYHLLPFLFWSITTNYYELRKESIW